MSGNNIPWRRKFLYHPLYGPWPFRNIGVSNITQIVILHAFHQASSIEDLVLIEPDNDIIFSMTFSWIKCTEGIVAHCEDRVAGENMFGLGICMQPA